MNLDPRHLHILAAVVDAGGLTEGAALIGKSQPSVSRTLLALEARLGTPLFQKGKRPLVPTELCLALAVEGRAVARATEHAAQTILRHSAGKSGTIRLAGTPIFMEGVIANMLAGFQVQFPEIRIDQTYGYLGGLLDQLQHDSIDLAVCPVKPAQLPKGYPFTPILPGRNVVVCAQNHPLARKPSLRHEDIKAYPWISPAAGSPLHDDLRGVLADIGISDIRISFTGGSLASILAILAGAQALTVLPYSVVFMQKPQHRLQALPIRIPHPARDLGILHCANRPPPPAVSRLIRYIQNQFLDLSATILKNQKETLWRN